MRQTLLTIIVGFISLLPAAAQQAATATLSGRVTDPAGGVIAGATVVAVQKETGVKRETETNSEGFYLLTNLAPGKYEVTIEATNFPQKLSRPFELNVGQQAVFNGTLQVSGPVETVTLDDRFNSPLVTAVFS